MKPHANTQERKEREVSNAFILMPSRVHTYPGLYYGILYQHTRTSASEQVFNVDLKNCQSTKRTEYRTVCFLRYVLFGHFRIFRTRFTILRGLNKVIFRKVSSSETAPRTVYRFAFYNCLTRGHEKIVARCSTHSTLKIWFL